MKLQVLVAALEGDWSLPEKMNLQGDAIIANQCDRWAVEERGSIRMLCSSTRGVGRNRNLALAAAQGEFLLFADDDMSYYPMALELVVKAFEQLPQADVLIFSMDMTRNGEIYEKRHLPVKRCYFHNSLKYGACRMAVRRESIEKAGLHFSQEFGGGSRYGSGEDSLFLCDCFRAGLQVWSHDLVLGRCAKDSSSWFEGYNERYFFDKGALFAALSPLFGSLLSLRFLLKQRKNLTELSFGEASKAMMKGRRDYVSRRRNREIQHHRADL